MYDRWHHISQQFVTVVEAIGSDTIPKGKREVPSIHPNGPAIVINVVFRLGLAALRFVVDDFAAITNTAWSTTG